MAKFSDYLSTDYLPGEIYSSGLDEYRSLVSPMDIQEYISSKKFKFSPSDKGDRFQDFLNLQSDPNYLIKKNIKVPEKFAKFLSVYQSV